MGIEQKRILFISSFNPDVLSFHGVSKKLYSEIETFKKFGYTVDYTSINNKGVFLQKDSQKEKIAKWEGTYYKTFVSLYKKLSRYDLKRWDIIYIRYEHISFSMLNFLKLYKKNKDGLVIGELPTYNKKPYSSDSFKVKIAFYLKRFLNIVLPKKIDYLVTFSDDNKIFGIPTIKIENFVDINRIPVKKQNIKSDNSIYLLVLAQLSEAHGVDLVIHGLANYLKQGNDRKIYVNIVGDGPILGKLKALTNELNLLEYVKFYGYLGGEELDHIFNMCDIGIGALAIFRKKSSKLSELKIREFTARGLPFIYNAYEPQLEGQFFAYKIPFKEEPLNMKYVIDFYDKLQKEPNIRERMRDFALSEFSSEIQLMKIKTVIDEYFS